MKPGTLSILTGFVLAFLINGLGLPFWPAFLVGMAGFIGGRIAGAVAKKN